MIFTADDRANDLILARLLRSREFEFLYARLEHQLPAGNGFVVFWAEQGKSVYRAVLVLFLGANGGHSKTNFFACRDRDAGRALALHLVAAVVVCKHLDEARGLLGLGRQRKRREQQGSKRAQSQVRGCEPLSVAVLPH